MWKPLIHGAAAPPSNICAWSSDSGCVNYFARAATVEQQRVGCKECGAARCAALGEPRFGLTAPRFWWTN